MPEDKVKLKDVLNEIIGKINYLDNQIKKLSEFIPKLMETFNEEKVKRAALEIKVQDLKEQMKRLEVNDERRDEYECEQREKNNY